MADLLAIISEDRSRQVSVAGLRADYDALRPGASTAVEVGTGWAEVAVLDHPLPPSVGVERAADGSWAAWAGSLLAPAELAGLTPAALEGQFALAHCDAASETLTVATDALGLKPLFVARGGGLVCFSTSALALARHLRLPPSRLGVEAFLRTGNQFGRGTPWEGVERVQPGEAHVFSPSGSERSVYWQPGVDPELRRLGMSDSVEACVELAARVFDELYAGERRPWADLTGGFDTRLLALLARRAGIEFEANTVGDESSEDVRIARQLAAAGGWPWTRLDLPPGWQELLPEQLAGAVAWSDCHLDAMQLAEVLETHRIKAESGTATLLTGGGGEHYRDYPWAHELWRAGRSNRVDFDRLLAWRLLAPLDLSAFRTDPTPAVVAARREEMEARVAPFGGASNTFQGDLLYAFKSTGHGGAYQAAAGAWVHMELPLYRRSVFSSAISIAPRHRNFHRMMREMIALLDPRLAAIQTETGGPAEPVRLANLPRFAPYGWRRAKRFGYRLRGRLLGAGGSHQASPRELARGSAIAALRAAGRLDPAQMRSAALYDPARLESVLSGAAADPAGVDWNLVGRIVTVELALEAVDAGIDP